MLYDTVSYNMVQYQEYNILSYDTISYNIIEYIKSYNIASYTISYQRYDNISWYNISYKSYCKYFIISWYHDCIVSYDRILYCILWYRLYDMIQHEIVHITQLHYYIIWYDTRYIMSKQSILKSIINTYMIKVVV